MTEENDLDFEQKIKDHWHDMKDNKVFNCDQLDEDQEEAIRFGELKKYAKELSLFLPEKWFIDVDYNELNQHRVSIISPSGVVVDSDHPS